MKDRSKLIFWTICAFLAGNLLAMAVAISRAQEPGETGFLKAYVVNPTGDEIFIGHLVPQPDEAVIRYNLNDNTVKIYVYEGLYGCFFDRIFEDRFRFDENPIP